jgi:hypothetical protein
MIRPTSSGQLDALGAIKEFIADGLFIDQPQKFINLLLALAHKRRMPLSA